MKQIIKATEYPCYSKDMKTIFLAGSIEMGKAEDWQTELTNHLDNVVIFNPRRDDWDSTWLQSVKDHQFFSQVNWELDHLEKADVIAMYFAPGTQSPISLMELGILTRRPKSVIVYCPEGFWRKGNVDVVCLRHGIPVYEDKEAFFDAVKCKLEW